MAGNKIQVQYFAILREQAGHSQENLESSASTPRELYAELAAKYDFHLSLDQVKVSINENFQPMDTPLKCGDTVVFIPPVAGG